MVIFAVINGLTMSFSSIAELVFEKKNYLKFSEKDKKLIRIIEEIELDFIQKGLDPNNMNLIDVHQHLDDKIEKYSRKGQISKKIEYMRFKQHLIKGIENVKKRNGKKYN